MGPAIVPVIAISPNPFLVMARSALISPRQLPQARIVSASRGLGRLVMKPNNLSKSIMLSDVKEIQAMLMMKLIIAYILIRCFGPRYLFVLIEIKMDMTNPGTSAPSVIMP